MEVSSIDTVMFKCSTIEHNSINAGTSENILWSNSSIQMWCTSMDWKTGYVIKTGPTEKVSVKRDKYPYKRSTFKDQKSNYGISILWTFGKDSEIRDNYRQSQLNIYHI